MRDSTDSVHDSSLAPPRRISLVVRLRFVATTLVLIAMIYVIPIANGFRGLSRPMPLLVACGGALLASMSLVTDFHKLRKGRAIVAGDELITATIGENDENAGVAARAALRIGAWLLAYVAMVAVVGVLVASIAFVVVFGRVVATWSWRQAAVSGVAMGVSLVVMREALGLRWPRSVLDWLGWLPYP